MDADSNCKVRKCSFLIGLNEYRVISNGLEGRLIFISGINIHVSDN